MIRIAVFLVFILCVSGLRLRAQDSATLVKRPIYVSGSFLYDFPESFGATIGIDRVLKTKLHISYTKKGVVRRKHRDIFIGGELGFYRYRFNHSGALALGTVGERHYKENHPFYFETFLTLALLRTFYDGIVYEVDANNNIHVKNNFGRFYGGVGIGLTTGWDLEKTKWHKPWTIQFRPTLWLQFPYNSFVLPHFTTQLSFKYHLPNWYSSVKQKRLIKHATSH